MFSHLFVGVADFARAHAFYAPLMSDLGVRRRFLDADHQWAAWQQPAGGRPLFIIGRPYDGQPHDAGNGQTTAFMAADRATVERVHRAALAAGGAGGDAPGLRPHDLAHDHGAYFRELDGNKPCVVWRDAPDAGTS